MVTKISRSDDGRLARQTSNQAAEKRKQMLQVLFALAELCPEGLDHALVKLAIEVKADEQVLMFLIDAASLPEAAYKRVRPMLDSATIMLLLPRFIPPSGSVCRIGKS